VGPSVTGAPSDVAIAGGGLVGLSAAYELVTRGARVTVIDAGHPGRATDAGAGILAPDTYPGDEPYWWEMARRAGEHYPLLLERLSADGLGADGHSADGLGADGHSADGHSVEGSAYARCGLLSVGLRESEDSWFAPFADRVTRRSAGRVREITADAATALFPPLGPVHRVLHYPDAARIDGRGMAAALRQASERRGVRFVSGTVSGVRAAGKKGIGSAGGAGGPGGAGTTLRMAHLVTIDGHEDLPCGALVVAGGAWSAELGEILGCPLPITPTKGQIVHLRTTRESDGWPIVQPLLTHYLVPWPGGRVACGGTFEAGAGFSATVTAAGLHELLRECLVVAPGLADAEYLFTRVGLRPTSPDDRPVVGAVPGWENVWTATGHGANGLLLGPYTAALLAAHIAGGTRETPLSTVPKELDPGRFS
jgi:D-amino-acid dehydrogenase